MKTVELFYLPTCPYCIRAREAIRELTEENPDYAAIGIKWIHEREEAAYADSKDYYYVPTIFFGDEKLYEANPGQSKKKIKACIQKAFDQVLAANAL